MLSENVNILLEDFQEKRIKANNYVNALDLFLASEDTNVCVLSITCESDMDKYNITSNISYN
ncbi:MAG TPA: hypothetical protein DC057_10120 [Spirochaetia bacterium]|nr:hypothetical protein [Spirochaetia bacterium]